MVRIGIRLEDKTVWESRVPLIPEHVSLLIREHGIDFTVQPSEIRTFSNNEYRDAGATVDMDLSHCDIIIAVKEIPKNLILNDKLYAFFSHVIKGQEHNMPLLKEIIDKRASLLDYEKITDDRGRRLLFFGNYVIKRKLCLILPSSNL